MIVHPEPVLSRSLYGAALAAVLFCVPQAAFAAISIHEVAWMGTAVSANDEWIELYNDGTSAVDLSGFVLSDGVTLSITLSGSIGSGGYFLLERTDDDTVPGVAAGVVYTGALGNDGRTLTLRRADSGLEDQIVGGTDWSNIGGDNTTKDTAQRTSGGWITAVATPGVANATSGSSSDDTDSDEGTEEDTEQEDEDTDEDDNVRISMVQAPRTPKLKIEGIATAHAGGAVSLRAIPSGISAQLVPSVVYEWNFGDGATGMGEEVSHVYTFPGTYAIAARAHYASYEAFARAAVTVWPIDLSLERGAEGQLFVRNDSPNDMDISAYQIIDGMHSFTFPPHTFILSHGAITLAPSILDRADFSESVFVRAAGGRHIALGAPPELLAEITIEDATSTLSLATTTMATTSEVALVPEEVASEEVMETQKPIVLGAAASASPHSSVPPWVTYGGLGVVIMLGIAALFFRGGSG